MTNWKWVRIREYIESAIPILLAINIVIFTIILIWIQVDTTTNSVKERARLEEKLNAIHAMAKHEQNLNPWVIISIIEGGNEND